MAFSRRRKSSRHRSSRSSRKTYWSGALWQGNSVSWQSNVAGGKSWFSFWSVWPSDRVEPDIGELTAADVTLVRSIISVKLDFEDDMSTPVNGVMGLIAFDGGELPGFYELGSFNAGSLVAPPNPALLPEDDWIIRIPLSTEGHAEDTGGLNVDRLWAESRAMRKLPPGVGVLAVLGFANVLASEEVGHSSWNFDARHALRSGYTR